MKGPAVHRYVCPVRPGDRPFIEQHARASVALVRRGSFCYRLGRRAHALGPGAVLLCNPGVEYVVTHEFGCGDECLIFEWDELPPSVRPFDRPMLPPLPRLEALARVAQAALSGTGDIGADEAGWALLLEVDRELTSGRNRRGGRAVAAGGPRDRERAIAAARLIDAQAGQPLPLETLAAHVGLSPFHFLRVFQRELAMTPHQYLIRLRLRRAIALLSDTDRAVTQVAYEVGFEDLSNFVRTFHRHVGCAPLAFRRSLTSSLPSMTTW